MKSKKEILKTASNRAWDDTDTEYDSILIIPAGTKHDSGYMRIAIVGVFEKDSVEQYEICGYPDDISCHFPSHKSGEFDFPLVRMDCFYPQGILRYHGRGKFKVGESLSSQDIYFIQDK